MKPRTAIGKVLLLAAASLGRGESIHFHKATVGAVPAGWIVAMTHSGGAPRWGVSKKDSALSKPNVLAQVSTDHAAGRFPLAIWDHASLKDGVLTVKFKAVSRTLDQGAGLDWRYKRRRVEHLRRETPSSQANLSTLSVGFHGSLFIVSLDNQKLFEVEDSTLTGAGKNGF